MSGVRSYLGGAVRVERLERERGPDGRFRTGDLRGEVAWIASGQHYEHLHVIEFAAAGVRRGFHRHLASREDLYVFRGSIHFLARAAGGGPRLELDLEAGDLVAIGPGVAHGFIAREPALAVAMGIGQDPVVDVHPAPDLDAG